MSAAEATADAPLEIRNGFELGPRTLGVILALGAVALYEVYQHYSAISVSDAVMAGTFGDEVLTEEDCDFALNAYNQLGFEAAVWEIAANAGIPGAEERAADLRGRQAALRPLLDACARAFGPGYNVN